MRICKKEKDDFEKKNFQKFDFENFEFDKKNQKKFIKFF